LFDSNSLLFLQKINPEELKRLEDENSKLTNTLKQAHAQLKNYSGQIANANAKLKDAEEKLAK
jgi:hypothetical protein